MRAQMVWRFTVVLLLFGVAPARAFNMLSEQEENKMGEDAYKEVLRSEKLCQDKEAIAFVERVAKRITAAAPDKGFKYELTVLDSDKVNAFCLPGGKICVYTALLPYCENEAGLAVVLGHEVAHAILRHGGKRQTQSTIVGGIGTAIGAVLSAKGASDTTQQIATGAYGYGSQIGILLPYSRSHETEADENGLMYMARAGYDPREAPAFWKRFSVLKSSTPSFLSTHPAHEDREKRLESDLPKAMDVYWKSERYGIGAQLPVRWLSLPPDTKAEKK